MKHRQGFVSNSSSASFIIQWLGGSESIEKEICSLFQWTDRSLIPHIVANTVKYGNLFKATFWTLMHNSYEDFGDGAIALLAAVVTERKLIDASVVRD
jgi:hypothetical protein